MARQNDHRILHKGNVSPHSLLIEKKHAAGKCVLRWFPLGAFIEECLWHACSLLYLRIELSVPLFFWRCEAL